MGVGTDNLGLTNHRIFEILRDGLGSINTKTQNIIDCKGDVLYLWNPVEQNVLILNIKNVKEQNAGGTKYQTLLPSDPPSFAVEALRVNETGTQLALSGPRGAAVLELPRRWGPAGAFFGGKDVVPCRCRTLDERFFVCNPYVGVMRTRWHPGSETDSTLVVLTSENTLRVYETLGGAVSLQRVWALGPTPHGSLSSAPRVPFLVGLGDTAVDFDFTPAELVPLTPQEERAEGSIAGSNSTAIQWPMLVLHGNGDVSKVVGSLKDDSACVVQGPLSMYPPAEDNYGADACSLLVLATVPPVVVIASCDGTLYHCALLPAGDDERGRKSWSQFDSRFSSQSPTVALYVLECVELELGLTLDDEVNSLTCPIHLHRHPVTNDRYLCSHDAGVHSVALPLIPYLEHFVNTDDAFTLLETPSTSLASVAEYVVCTRTSTTETPAPVLGLAFSQNPTVVVVMLLGSGEVLSLPLPTVILPELSSGSNQYQPPPGIEFTSPLKQILKEPFDTRIKNVLKRNSTQPILKLSSGGNPTPRETLELVARTTKTFREEYLLKHKQVREEIERRVRILKALKEHQVREVQALEAEKATLQQTAEKLAEKYEDAKDKQEELSKRAEQVLRIMVQKQPVVSTAEKKLAKDLEEIKERLEQFKKGLAQVQAKQNYHKEQVNEWQAQQRKRDVYLNQTRASTIRSTLVKVTEEIAELVRCVHSVKEDLKM
ncbi:hypothetical protein R5R35_006360 [Gryllus longicercus]